MKTIGIPFFTGSGHTGRMAEAVAKGASNVAGISVKLLPILGEHIVNGRYQNEEALKQLDECDGILFGSPTYMGGPAAQFKAFADATGGRWFASVWRNKVAGGFTVSNSPSGDKFNTLQYFFTLAMQHGMIWVGLGEMPLQPNGVNHLGGFSGAMAQAGQEDPKVAPGIGDLRTGEILGARLAGVVLQIRA